jgi:hypothetical protein
MVPYEIIIPDLTGGGAAPAVVTGQTQLGLAIPSISRGMIKQLRVIELGTSHTGFSYALFKSIVACDPALYGAARGGIVEALYQIGPTFTVTSGQTQFASSEGFPEDGVSNLDLAFCCLDNQDGTPMQSLGRYDTTNRGRTLYLRIVPASAPTTGGKAYGVALTTVDPIF